MICLANVDNTLQLEFDLLENLPSDFDSTESKFEKWVPFVLHLSTPQRTVAIPPDMRACMTVFEIERIYNGIKDLLSNTAEKKDRQFAHYSSESFFEISFEYLHVDKHFSVELWFIIAEAPEGRIVGYDAGFRFIVGEPEMKKFAEEFRGRFQKVCPQLF